MISAHEVQFTAAMYFLFFFLSVLRIKMRHYCVVLCGIAASQSDAGDGHVGDASREGSHWPIF